VLGLEFGEKVSYEVEHGYKWEKIDSRWECGILLGVRRKSGEVWVATDEKLICVRTVGRIPIQGMCCMDCLTWIPGVPWNTYKGHRYADGDMPAGAEARDAFGPFHHHWIPRRIL